MSPINTCPVKIQAHENKTLHMLVRTIGDEPVSLHSGVCMWGTNSD